MQPLVPTLQVFPSYRLLLAHLSFELGRARRYQHAAAVAVVWVEYDRLVQHRHKQDHAQGDADPAFHLYVSFLGSLLRDNLRASDIIAYDATKERYVILLPETTGTEAESPVLRLSELAYKRMAIPLRIGIAEFPVNGLIIDDLINSAEGKSSHRFPAGQLPQLHAGKDNGAMKQDPMITKEIVAQDLESE